MILAWRICKEKHVATAFDGHGARLNGGRWNSPGVSLVYTSSVASLAFLEMLVHTDVAIASLSYKLIQVEIDDRLVKELNAATLPADWRKDQSATRRIGDAWARSAKSLVLRVPSAILHVDHNLIINPTHPEMRRLRIGAPQSVIIDDRIKALLAGK